MKSLKTLFIIGVAFLAGFIGSAQNVESYTLDNGLTVILDANKNDKHVFGSLVVHVGSVDEKWNATGMAHYLEHMLFKGTTELGSSHWEEEKKHYDKIITLYDELQKATDEEQVKAINKKINDETKKQSQYIITNEFSAAVQQMGGKYLNASTGFERTNYFNAFPSNQVEKWLSLYAHRLKNPVFRLFQTELETVYEEKNRSSDNLFMDFVYQVEEVVHGADSPYARPIIGETEHLKKPWMSAMIEFFDTWYVPNNMALILSGKFEVEEVRPLIEAHFGGLERKPLPERNPKALQIPSKKIKEKYKLTPYLVGIKTYIIPNNASLKETVAAEFIGNILSNSFETGYLDKMYADGDVLSAQAYFQESKVGKRITIEYVPKFDINQFRQESLSFTEKMVLKAVDKIKKGDYDAQQLENIKTSMVQNFERMRETPSSRVNLYTKLFVDGKDLNYIEAYLEELNAIDKQYVTAIANRYLTEKHITVDGEIGRSKKKEEIEKPELDPVKFNATTHASSYLDTWMDSEKGNTPFDLFDPKSIAVTPFQDKVDLHYLENEQNDLFRLIVRFGAGNKKYPMLKYATRLMNNSGVLNQYTADALKKGFGDLSVSYSFSSSDNYTYILMEGYDDKLGEACQLLSRLMLIPEITEKSMEGIIGRELNQRNIEEKSIASVQDALFETIIYGDKSNYIDRPTNSDLIALAPSELTAVFNNAISHEADIYYYGRLAQDEVKNVLTKNLAFGANRKDRVPLQRKAFRTYDKNTIFLVNEPKASQAHIYLFIESDKIPLAAIPGIEAFNQYFSGGFNGLMLKEIRENRALSYSAGASLGFPTKRTWNSGMTGYVGTQADKTTEAVSVIVELIKTMPEYPERMRGIKDYLKNSAEVDLENKGSYLLASENWKEMGYMGNPLAEKMTAYDQLTFDDVKKVFDKMVKDRPYAIGIVGKTGDMDLNQLAAFGKVVKLNKAKLFASKK